MKIRGIIFYVLMLSSLSAICQSKLEFQFDQARVHLAQRELDQAIKILEPLYLQMPNNANISFLLGAAYTESNQPKKAINFLIKAARNFDEEYRANDYRETAAPLHVFYYLTLAMAEDNQCVNSHESYHLFKRYREKVDPYFIDEAKRYTEKCPVSASDTGSLAELLAMEQPFDFEVEIDTTPVNLTEKVKLDSASLEERGYLVKKLEYSTRTPLYGVQIATHTRPAPIGSYSDIKNIDAFIDNEGAIRYVVGHFAIQSQAERLLEKIKQKGYVDAFVVNVNNERKYSNELISHNNVNLRDGIKGKVEYYIQVAALSEEASESELDVYFAIDDISEITYNDKTILAVGAFDTYRESKKKEAELKAMGYKDAYIVAFNKGKKIDLTVAKRYTD